MWTVGDRVFVENEACERIGTIVEFSTNYVLIHLDSGFWSEDRKTFVSLLPVHENNLRVIENESNSR